MEHISREFTSNQVKLYINYRRSEEHGAPASRKRIYIIMTRMDIITEANFNEMVAWSQDKLCTVHSRATWHQIAELAQILDLPERPPAPSRDWRVSPNSKNNLVVPIWFLVVFLFLAIVPHMCFKEAVRCFVFPRTIPDCPGLCKYYCLFLFLCARV
jgi:hypothetical protein